MDDFAIIYSIIYLVVGLIFGFVCRAIVKNKGYSDYDNHGFAWGFWLGWIGLIVCCLKPNNYQSYMKNYQSYISEPIIKTDNSVADSTSIIRELENLQKMKEMSMISDEDFEKKKNELTAEYNRLAFNSTVIHHTSWICPDCKTSNPISYSNCSRCYCGRPS